MARDYSTLTGQGVLDGIRKTHRARIAGDIFLILFAAGFLIGCVIMLMNNHRDVFRIVMALLGIAGCIVGNSAYESAFVWFAISRCHSGAER